MPTTNKVGILSYNHFWWPQRKFARKCIVFLENLQLILFYTIAGRDKSQLWIQYLQTSKVQLSISIPEPRIGWGKTLPYWGKIDNFLRLLIGEKLCPRWKFGDIKGDPMGSSGLQGCPKRSGGTFCGITGDQRGVSGTSRGSQGVKGDI